MGAEGFHEGVLRKPLEGSNDRSGSRRRPDRFASSGVEPFSRRAASQAGGEAVLGHLPNDRSAMEQRQGQQPHA